MNKHYIKKELIIGDFKHEGYFTEFELDKGNLLFTDLIFYIDNYYNKDFDKKYIYNHLLIVFIKILKFFFRAPLKLNKLKWYKRSIKALVTEYLLFRNILVNDKYEKDVDSLFKNNPIIDSESLENIDKESYFKLIADLYYDLDFLMSKIQVKRNEYKLTIKDFDRNKPPFDGKEYSTLRFMQKKIKTRLDKQIDFFLIQGSYATADFVRDWSDLDTHIILNKDIFNDIKELEYTQKELHKLSLLCYKINPLAHHTLFIFPALILKHYLTLFLPVPVLEQAIALKKNGDLILQQVDSRVEEFNDFQIYLTFFREKVEKNKYSKNLQEWENDIAHILMLPTLTLQMKEGPLYKKFSFSKIKKAFPEFDFGLVDWAEKKRKEWQLFNFLRLYPNIFFNLLPNSFNNYFVNKYRFYLMRFKKITDSKEVENFTKKSLNLYEGIFNHCLKNYKENG